MATGVTEGSSCPEFEPPKHKFSCSPCSKDGRYIEAVCWCVNCEESFCSACLDSHGKFNMTRDHEILDEERMEDWDKVKAPLLPKERCSQHHSRVTDMFCGDHNVVGCATCMAEYHRCCDDVGYIPEVAEDMETNEELINTKTKNAELITEIKRLQELRKRDIQRIQQEKEDIFRNIADFKEKIIQKVTGLEMKANAEIEELFIKYKTKIAHDIERLNKHLHDVERNGDSLENFVGDNKSQLFVHVKKGGELSEKTADLKAEIGNCHEELRFELDDSILEQHEMIESIGEVIEFSPISLAPEGNYNVKTKTDKVTCDISGCCFLEDGSVVITDFANSNIKHLSLNYSVALQKTLTEKPVDICCTGHNFVAIALGKHIQFAELSDTIKLDPLVCVTVSTNGIAYCNERVFVSCQQEGSREAGRVRIYSVTGTLLKMIPLQMDNCFAYHLIATECSVVVADGQDQIIMFDHSGNALWTFHHESLNDTLCVRGLDDRSLLVLGRKSNNLLQVALGGIRHKVVLDGGGGDDLNAPYSMAYDKSGQKLIVVSDKTDEIAVYNVEYYVY